jgi:hypothetical protein
VNALTKEWYGKLKDSGFVDIETGDEHCGLLKTDKRIEAERHTEYEASAEYYQRAGQFLHSEDWQDDDEREIWFLHSEGIGQNEIARRTRRGNTFVNATVVRMRAKMLRKRGNSGNRAKNGPTLWRWLERETRKMSDADLIALAPTLLEIAKPSTPKRCLTK